MSEREILPWRDEAKRATKAEPNWGDPWRLPFCSGDHCPQYDGKRCRIIGFQPDLLCEPIVRWMAAQLDEQQNAAPRKGQEEVIPESEHNSIEPHVAELVYSDKYCERCGASVEDHGEAPSLPSRIRAIADDYTNHHYRRTLRELADEAEGEGHGP